MCNPAFKFTEKGEVEYFESIVHNWQHMNELPHQTAQRMTDLDDKEYVHFYINFWADFLQHLSNRVRELDPGIGGHMTLEEIKKLTREDIDRMSDDETLEVLVTLATKGDEVMMNKLIRILGGP